MSSNLPREDRLMLAVVTLFIPTLWWLVLGGALLAVLHYGLQARVWTPAVGLVLAGGYGWLVMYWLIALERQSLVNSLRSVENMPTYNDLWKKRDEAFKDVNRALGTWNFVRLVLWVLPVLIGVVCGLCLLLLGLVGAVHVQGPETWLWPLGLGLAAALVYLYPFYRRTRQETMGY